MVEEQPELNPPLGYQQNAARLLWTEREAVHQQLAVWLLCAYMFKQTTGEFQSVLQYSI